MLFQGQTSIWKFWEFSTWRLSIVHRRDFLCSRGLINPQEMSVTDFYKLSIFLDFLTTLPYSLKEAHQLCFYFKKHVHRTRKPPTPIFRRTGTSRANWDQNPKVREPKKCEGCLGLAARIFKWKNQEIRRQNSFEIWLRERASTWMILSQT